MREGTPDLDANPGVLVTAPFAEANGWQLGDDLPLTAPGLSEESREVEVVGIFEPNSLVQNMILAEETVEGMLPPGAAEVTMVGVVGDGSVTQDELRANLEEAVKGFIVVQVLSAEEMAGMAG